MRGCTPAALDRRRQLRLTSARGCWIVWCGCDVMHVVSTVRTTRLNVLIATGVCAMFVAGILASVAPWLARESIFEFTAREPKSRNPPDPGESPSGGPGTLE